MSKGSTPRPFQVSNQEYATRWDAIFGKDNAEKNNQEKVGAFESDRACDRGSSDNAKGQTRQAKNP